MSVRQLAAIVAKVAEKWREPAHEPREKATRLTLERENRFTREAVTFAVNQQVHLLRTDALVNWIGGESVSRPATVAVVNPGNIPFAELQDFLAVTLLGHRYRGKLSSRSPYLLQAFLDDLIEHGASVDARLGTDLSELEWVDALIASGTDDTTAALASLASTAGIDAEKVLMRGNRFSIAVISRSESSDILDRLAEDVLLHEGLGCRSVAIVWAPVDESPDGLLDAMARFRAVFPAHPDTAGGLTIQIAFYRATNLPHAYAEDDSFLVSRGDPEVQQPAHVRWTEYRHHAEVNRWIDDHRLHLELVVVSPTAAQLLEPVNVKTVEPGRAQRPRLGWRQDGVDVVAFLRSLVG